MKVLLHVCCGPCAIYPLTRLREEGFEVSGFFYNPNIHPYQEFKRRLLNFEQYSKTSSFPAYIDKQYGLREFVQKIAFHENERCQICYRIRLEKTVAIAKEMGCDAFSTTLLYSKYQRHSFLTEMCHNLSIEHGIRFLYRDFREGWQAGVERAIELNMYRQPYCGCIYSEQERYDKSYRKHTK